MKGNESELSRMTEKRMGEKEERKREREREKQREIERKEIRCFETMHVSFG